MRSMLVDADWNPRLDLALLYTPLDRCQSVTLGPLDQGTVTALEAERLDQAPVLDGPRGVLGIVRTEGLKALASSGQALLLESPLIEHTRIEPNPFLAELLATLDARRAVLVATGDRVDGLLSISDLNKHAFRVALYMVFAALEIVLAEVIRARCLDHNEWIGLLKEYDQVRVLGSWEVAKRKSVDTSRSCSGLSKASSGSPTLCAVGLRRRKRSTRCQTGVTG